MTESGTPPADAEKEERNQRNLRIARRVILASMVLVTLLLLGIPMMDASSAVGEGLSPWRTLVAEALAVPLSVAGLFLLRDRLDGRRTPDPWLYWGSIVLLVIGSALLQSPVSLMLFIGTWWAFGVFVASRRRGFWVTLGLLVFPWLVLLLSPLGLNPLPYSLVWFGAVVWALILASGTLVFVWLWDITNDAVDGQRARARLAVTEERLRFSRDMHDLLGHSLSALAVKSELAGRLAERAPERAAAEIAEVRALARRSLQQVRSAVSGYREVSLVEEVASVSAVLRANRARVTVTGLETLELPPRSAALAAWVVREGGTNVLRHSDATECQIGFTLTKGVTVGPKTLVVEVSNDRAHGGGGEGAAFGNGLAGLSERVAMGGGTLSAARTSNGGFLLRAVLPL